MNRALIICDHWYKKKLKIKVALLGLELQTLSSDIGTGGGLVTIYLLLLGSYNTRRFKK